MAEGKKEKKATDEESVKLFVGQVPKHMTEAQLLAMFKEFALVDEVNIIKDKTTRASRGSTCLFFFKIYYFFLNFQISHISHSLFAVVCFFGDLFDSLCLE